MPNLIYCEGEFYRISPENSRILECSDMGTHPWKLCYNKREVGHFYKLECGNNVLFAWTSKGVFYSESRGHYWHLVRPHAPSRIIQKQSKQIKLEGNKMSKKELLNDEKLIEKITKEAWGEASMMVQWDIPLLEKFKDKVDWKKVSESFVVLWSLLLLERFEQYICWDTLSDNYNPALLQENIIDKFIDHWNWTKLTNNLEITWTTEKIDKYANHLDWSMLLDRLENLFSDDMVDPFLFYQCYKKYIPNDLLVQTELWAVMRKKMREEEYNKIMQQINTL